MFCRFCQTMLPVSATEMMEREISKIYFLVFGKKKNKLKRRRKNKIKSDSIDLEVSFSRKKKINSIDLALGGANTETENWK